MGIYIVHINLLHSGTDYEIGDSSFLLSFPFDIFFMRKKGVAELETAVPKACPRLDAR